MAETAKTPKTKAAAPNGGDHDRVVMASRRPDGTPAQTENFTFIGDEEATLEATKAQLTEQAVSAVDVEVRGWSTDTGDEDGDDGPDPAIAELVEAQDAATSAAEAQAEAEVKARFETPTQDPRDPAAPPADAGKKG